jgi:hypothetical protein
VVEQYAISPLYYAHEFLIHTASIHGEIPGYFQIKIDSVLAGEVIGAVDDPYRWWVNKNPTKQFEAVRNGI